MSTFRDLFDSYLDDALSPEEEEVLFLMMETGAFDAAIDQTIDDELRKTFSFGAEEEADAAWMPGGPDPEALPRMRHRVSKRCTPARKPGAIGAGRIQSLCELLEECTPVFRRDFSEAYVSDSWIGYHVRSLSRRSSRQAIVQLPGHGASSPASQDCRLKLFKGEHPGFSHWASHRIGKSSNFFSHAFGEASYKEKHIWILAEGIVEWSVIPKIFGGQDHLADTEKSICAILRYHVPLKADVVTAREERLEFGARFGAFSVFALVQRGFFDDVPAGDESQQAIGSRSRKKKSMFPIIPNKRKVYRRKMSYVFGAKGTLKRRGAEDAVIHVG